MSQGLDFVRLKDGAAASTFVYRGSWPPPERLRVFHFGNAVIGFVDAAADDVPNVMEAQESFYARGLFSQLPDDHGSSHVGRGAEYRVEP